LFDAAQVRALRSYFRHRGCSHELSEDLAQETIVKALSYCRSNVIFLWRAFIYRIASNLLLDHHRASLRPECSLDACELDGEYPDVEALIEERTPEHIVATRAALMAAVSALAELDWRTRAVFVLYRLDGMRQHEVASALGVSISLVEKSVAIAVAHLQEARSAEPARALRSAERLERLSGRPFAEEMIDSLLFSARNGEGAGRSRRKRRGHSLCAGS
jgi:RNA polymerase sigma-70 factor (ECF subfamily)